MANSTAAATVQTPKHIVLNRKSSADFFAAPTQLPPGTKVEVYWPGPSLDGIWSPGVVVSANWSPGEEYEHLYDINVNASGDLDAFMLRGKPPHEVRRGTEAVKKRGCWGACCPSPNQEAGGGNAPATNPAKSSQADGKEKVRTTQPAAKTEADAESVTDAKDTASGAPAEDIASREREVSV